MVTFLLLPTVAGIKFGGRRMSFLLYWIFFFPLLFISTDVIYRIVLQADMGLIGTSIRILTFLTLIIIFLIVWKFWLKMINIFFPDHQRRAGGAFAGMLIGTNIAAWILILFVMLHPSKNTVFKLPIVPTVMEVTIDLESIVFGYFHGQLADFGDSILGNNSPGASSGSGVYSSDYESPMDTIGIKEPADGEDIPIWARPPPDYDGWEYPEPSWENSNPNDSSPDSTFSQPFIERELIDSHSQIESGPLFESSTIFEDVGTENDSLDPAEYVPREKTE